MEPKHDPQLPPIKEPSPGRSAPPPPSRRGSAFTPPTDQPWATIALLGLGMLASSLPYLGAQTARGLGADLLSYVLKAAVFWLGPLIAVTAVNKKPLSSLGLRAPASWPRAIIVGIGSGVLFYGLNVLISVAQVLIFSGLTRPQEYVTDLLARATPFEFALLALLLLAAVPLTEELLFRAYFLPALIQRYGRGPGFAVCAAVFACTHASLWTLVPLFCCGLGLAWLYDRYHCLWYNVLAHAAWNLSALLLFVFAQ